MEDTKLYHCQAGPGDSDQNDVSFSTAQYKHSNVLDKRSIAGPSANRNKRYQAIMHIW